MNLFLYKETHFFGFIQFSSLLAQLCYLVAHPVGYGFPRTYQTDAVVYPGDSAEHPIPVGIETQSLIDIRVKTVPVEQQETITRDS